MIFRKEFLKKVKDGEVTIAFRQWKKLSISEGGKLKTSGVILFKRIKVVTANQITKADAKKAGFLDIESLFKDLSGEGTIYKISFVLFGPDPRIKLRETTVLGLTEKQTLLKKLKSLDNRGSIKNWIKPVLNHLKKYPGSPSKTISNDLGLDQAQLKLNIRKLKNLGLTISLGTGYKISPRGQSILKLLG